MNTFNRVTKGRVTRVLIALCFLSFQSNSLATIFDIDGEVTSCNNFACNLAGLATGDQISGNLIAEDAASGANSTFTGQEIISVELGIGDIGGEVVEGPFDNTELNTDADGEIVSGSAQFSTDFETNLGIATIDIVVDAELGTWTASTDFFNLGEVAAGTLSLMRRAEEVDTDEDGVVDIADNCTLLANADQRDSNGDGFGNVCDPDLDNNNVVNFLDTAAFAGVFGSADGGDADFNGDGFVNFIDFALFASYFFQAPGPSGIAP